MGVYGYYTEDGELYHHGVKGMRWGVRKDKSSYNTDARRRKLKRAAIIGGSVLGAAALAGGGYALSRGIKKNNARKAERARLEAAYKSNAKAQYDATQGIINRIKNDPNAHRTGGQYAQAVRNNQVFARINANPKAKHTGGQYAQAVRNNHVIDRITSSPNYHVTGGQYAQAVRNNQVIERIKNDPNAYNAGNKYAKKRNS